MVTILIFRSLLLIVAVLESSSLVSKQQRSIPKITTTTTNATTTTVSQTSLNPGKSKHSIKKPLNNWIPLRSITSSTPSTSEKKRAQQRVATDPTYNPYEYSESKKSVSPVDNNYASYYNAKNFLSTPIFHNNSNKHPTLASFPSIGNQNSYTTHPSTLRNEPLNKSNRQPYDTGMPTRFSSISSNLKKPMNFQSSIYSHNEFSFNEPMRIMRGELAGPSSRGYQVKVNKKPNVDFSSEDFDTLFDTEFHTSLNSLKLPIHRDKNNNNPDRNKATNVDEHYQLLSNQPQLHFHMNPSQQTLYDPQASPNPIYAYDLPERNGNNRYENGVSTINSHMDENFHSIHPLESFHNSDFSDMSTSNIFQNYDKIFGQHPKMRPEVFTGERVQAQPQYSSPFRGQEYKQQATREREAEVAEVDNEEGYVDESGESSLTSHQQYENEKEGELQYNERGQSESDEKPHEDGRVGESEESYKKEFSPRRVTEYEKEISSHSSEQSEETLDKNNNNRNENQRSVEVNKKDDPIINSSSLVDKKFRQKSSASVPDRFETRASMKKLGKFHKTRNLEEPSNKSHHTT